MNSSAADSPAATTAHPDRNRLRFELIFASVWLAVGLFLMPALIFAVGNALLEPYGADGKGSLGTFYGDFFAGLAEPSVRTWLIALGPLILISVLRAVFMTTRKSSDTDAAPQSPPRQARRTSQEHTRVEPRISSD